MTLPKLFQEQGYSTAMYGKWHLGFQYIKEKGVTAPEAVKDRFNYGQAIGTKIPDGPITRGFDQFLGFHHSGSMSSLITNDEVTEYVDCINMMDLLTDAVVDHLKDHAQQESPKPFFIYYPMNSPHAPVVPQEDWKTKGGIEGDYPGFVAQTDDRVGQVLKALEDNGLKENTIVIFGTDNGCHQTPALYLDRGHSVSGPLRDKKTSIYEGGHRIPFIIRWDGVVEAGQKTDQLICMTDIFATFAEYFSYDIVDNAAEDSISFLPLLKGEELEIKRQNIIHHDQVGRFAAREGDWKLILRPDELEENPTGKETEFQLYNVKEDISETNNLANEQPEKVEELLTLLKKQVTDGRSTPGEKQENDTKVDIYKKGVKTVRKNK